MQGDIRRSTSHNRRSTSFLTGPEPCDHSSSCGCLQQWTQIPLPRTISTDWNILLRMNKRPNSLSFSKRSSTLIRSHGSRIRMWLVPVNDPYPPPVLSLHGHPDLYPTGFLPRKTGGGKPRVPGPRIQSVWTSCPGRRLGAYNKVYHLHD